MQDDTGEKIAHTAPSYIVRHRGYDEEFDDAAAASDRIKELTRLYPGEFIDAFQYVGSHRYRPAPEDGDAND